MLPSVHAFLSQIIDYAGMFPPAKLPLEEALRQYLDYRRTSPHAWMLGRFVCPAAQLLELAERAKSDPNESLLQVAALLPQSSTVDDFLPRVHAGLKSIQEYRQAWGSADAIDMIEMTLPPDMGDKRMPNRFGAAEGAIAQAGIRSFFEIPMTDMWSDDVAEILQRILWSQIDGPRTGLKIRCGGVADGAFPTDGQLAQFMVRCRDANVPWKATAGLHHPRRHWDPSVQLWHHGFLNVFGAGILALAHPLTEADIVAILSDRQAEHFRFDADGFAWKDWSCPTAKIIELRATATSFGSCSFEEPCEDLIKLGLIETKKTI